jgi:hypothetical protein
MRTNLRAAALLVVAAMALGACKASVTVTTNGSSGSAGGSYNTYNDNGVSFQYPSAWQELTPTSPAAQTGSQSWSATFGPTSGQNVVVVTAYTLPLEVNAGNLDKVKSQVASTLGKIATQAGGSFSGNLSPTTMGGFPAFQADISVSGTSGTTLQSSVIVAFNASTEYFVNCQYDSSSKNDVLSACDQIKGSFKSTSG